MKRVWNLGFRVYPEECSVSRIGSDSVSADKKAVIGLSHPLTTNEHEPLSSTPRRLGFQFARPPFLLQVFCAVV